MNKICTSLEQSKKLMELGVDVDTADMIYQPTMDIDSMSNVGFVKTPLCFPFNEVKECNIQYLPAWSLNSLLSIIKNRKDCNKVDFFSNYASKWVLTTTYYNSVWKEKEIIAEDSIDAAFEMVIWLKENDKI